VDIKIATHPPRFLHFSFSLTPCGYTSVLSKAVQEQKIGFSPLEKKQQNPIIDLIIF